MTQITGTLQLPGDEPVTLRFQALDAGLQILPGFTEYETVDQGPYDFELAAGNYRFHYYAPNLLSRPYQITVPSTGPVTLGALLGYQDPIDPTPAPSGIEVLETWSTTSFTVEAA